MHLLPPRHGLFNVRIEILNLASVPLVSGEFGVRWKFKNTHKIKGKTKKLLESDEHDGDGDSFGSAETSAEDPGPAPEPQISSSARGQTQWLPLRDHSVTWNQQLATVVQMSIDRDTHQLLPHHFKLTVLQRVIAHDPDAPHRPRLGVVELDLAEYADSQPLPPGCSAKGLVTRRYLLRDSKTNATLRLAIHVEPINTATSYVAPPLPNGEILAGVSTLLTTHDDVYRTRPRALDLYAPLGASASSSRSSLQSKVSLRSERQSFDLHSLPRAYGPGPTESLIEALFNPAPVKDQHLISPFTKLVRTESGSSLPSSPSFSTSTTRSSPRPSLSNDSATNSSHHHSPSITSSLPSALNSGGHHWWQRNRDHPPSRSASRAGAVAA